MKSLGVMNPRNLLLSLPLLTLLSCSQGLDTPNPANGGKSLRFDMSAASEDIIANTNVYVFDGSGPQQSQFNHQVLNIDRSGQALSMDLPTGLWDLMLVSADPNTRKIIQTPQRGDTPLSSQKMVEFSQWDTSEPNTSKAPEVRTGRIDAVTIAPTTPQTKTTDLARHAAMIKIVLAEALNIKVGGSHLLELRDIPNALSWSGSLYPNKDTPQTGDPMRLPVTIKTDPSGQNQSSNTLTFIVPAHVGSDHLSDNPTDISTHKLNLWLKLENADGSYTEYTTQLPIVPKANKIIEARLYIKSDLTVDATIRPWIDHDATTSLVDAWLSLNKNSLAMALCDTLYAKYNGPHNKLALSAPDLFVRIYADDDTYELTVKQPLLKRYLTNLETTGQRTLSIPNALTITAGNLTKRLDLTLRPDNAGTTHLENKDSEDPKERVILSPASPTKSVQVRLHNQNNVWLFLTPENDKVTIGPREGFGDAEVTLERKTSTNDLSAYGNTTLRLFNQATFDIDNLEVSNLWFDGPESIHIGNPVDHTDTIVYNNEIVAMGGSERFTVTAKPNWITEAVVEPDGRLRLKALRDPNEEARSGQITIAHADDPNYTKSITVAQDVIVRIPEFDYLQLRLHWKMGEDMDIAVQFVDNGWNRDELPIGWGMSADPTGQNKYNHWLGVTGAGDPGIYVDADGTGNRKFLHWAGDGKSSTEDVILYAGNVNALDNLPRYIKVDVYANWAKKGIAPKATDFSIYAYQGGTMKHVETSNEASFENENGTKVYDQTFSTMVTTEGLTNTASIYDNGGYSYVGRVTYDRIKHTADVDMVNTTRSGTQVPYLPGKR